MNNFIYKMFNVLFPIIIINSLVTLSENLFKLT